MINPYFLLAAALILFLIGSLGVQLFTVWIRKLLSIQTIISAIILIILIFAQAHQTNKEVILLVIIVIIISSYLTLLTVIYFSKASKDQSHQPPDPENQ
jgi:NADH:ubiquinone oxidoreductase subunit K